MRIFLTRGPQLEASARIKLTWLRYPCTGCASWPTMDNTRGKQKTDTQHEPQRVIRPCCPRACCPPDLSHNSRYQVYWYAVLSTALTWIFAVVAAASDTWFEGSDLRLGAECDGGGAPCARCECRTRGIVRPTSVEYLLVLLERGDDESSCFPVRGQPQCMNCVYHSKRPYIILLESRHQCRRRKMPYFRAGTKRPALRCFRLWIKVVRLPRCVNRVISAKYGANS